MSVRVVQSAEKSRTSPASLFDDWLDIIARAGGAGLTLIGIFVGIIGILFLRERTAPKPTIVTLNEKESYFVFAGAIAIEDQQGGVYKVSFQAEGMSSSQTFYGVRAVKTEEMTANRQARCVGRVLSSSLAAPP
jgi:hypothetical protein